MKILPIAQKGQNNLNIQSFKQNGLSTTRTVFKPNLNFDIFEEGLGKIELWIPDLKTKVKKTRLNMQPGPQKGSIADCEEQLRILRNKGITTDQDKNKEKELLEKIKVEKDLHERFGNDYDYDEESLTEKLRYRWDN